MQIPFTSHYSNISFQFIIRQWSGDAFWMDKFEFWCKMFHIWVVLLLIFFIGNKTNYQYTVISFLFTQFNQKN